MYTVNPHVIINEVDTLIVFYTDALKISLNFVTKRLINVCVH